MLVLSIRTFFILITFSILQMLLLSINVPSETSYTLIRPEVLKLIQATSDRNKFLDLAKTLLAKTLRMLSDDVN